MILMFDQSGIGEPHEDIRCPSYGSTMSVLVSVKREGVAEGGLTRGAHGGTERLRRLPKIDQS